MRINLKSTKRNLFLAVALFVSMSTVLNAQNVLGKMNADTKLHHVRLEHFKDGRYANEEKADQTFFFEMFNLYEMHNMNLYELNSFVFENLRIEGNKMFGSTLGSPKEEIIIAVDEQRGDAGLAIMRFARELEMPFSVDFMFDNDNRQLIFKYRIDEPFFDKENETHEELNERFEALGYYIAHIIYTF